MYPGGGNGGHSNIRNRINQTPLHFSGVGGSYIPQHYPHPHQNMNLNSMLQLPPYPVNPLARPVSLGSSGGGGGGGDEDEDIDELLPKRDEKFPQWGIEETKEFIGIRSELESQFTGTKRNRPLWELVVAKLRAKGYNRTIDQCKSKWKCLVNKFKEKETTDPNNETQCPFFEGMQYYHASYSEAGSSRGGKRGKSTSGGGGGGGAYEDDENESVGDKKKKAKIEIGQETTNNENENPNSILEVLRVFFNEQQKIDMEWRKSMDKRQQERILFESEWRQGMEKLERERIMMEQSRRAREEQRWLREESLAEKRDALLTALFNKFIRD